MKYGVRLEGKNFEMNTEEGMENLGFFTTRFVKASSAEEAEARAVELVWADKGLNAVLAQYRKYEPMLYLVECWKESWWKKLGGEGYTFYPMGPGEGRT